jgi:hypothetical protein
MRSKTELLEYLEKHPEVPQDATVTNFNRHDIPEDKEVIDGAAPNLSGDDNPDLIENGNQGSPEHSLSPPRCRMPHCIINKYRRVITPSSRNRGPPAIYLARVITGFYYMYRSFKYIATTNSYVLLTLIGMRQGRFTSLIILGLDFVS